MTTSKITNEQITPVTIFVIAAILISSSFSFGQSNSRVKGEPQTIIETFQYLDEVFDDTAKYSFCTLPEDVSITRFYGLKELLWSEWIELGSLTPYFEQRGIRCIPFMEKIILTSYYRYLNKQPIKMEDQVAYYQSLQDLLNHNDSLDISITDLVRETPDSVLIEYFPIGDTIQVKLFATRRKFMRYYASGTIAEAVVKEHENNKLQVEAVYVKSYQKLKPSRKIGDIFETDLESCSLLPPRNWHCKE